MIVRKTIAFLALLLGISTMGYARVQLAAADQIYQEGNAVYSEISSKVRQRETGNSPAALINAEKKAAGTAERPAASETDVIPESVINFDTLKTISTSATSWLYCPDTLIDYPVMIADDYNYYLHHLPDGTQNANGSLFIDFNCAPDFSDPITIIYGHNMRSGSMFGSLKGYKDQKYFDEHPFMYLYTEHGNYRIELLYGSVIGAGQWRERAFMYKENVDALIAYSAHNTTFRSSAVYDKGDRVIAMSTCSYEFEEARFVVIGVLRGDE